MKTFKTVIIAAMLLFVPAYAFSSNLGYMRISLIKGDVQIKTPDAGEWGLASINGPLGEGDQVWTPQGSRAELQLSNGTYIRLDQDTALQILSMDKDSSQFYISQGRAYIFYDAPRGSVMQIDTPDASARAFNRAILRVDLSDQYTDVAVYKGSVTTENNAGLTRINAGQMLSLGQNTNGEVALLGPADEWEEWNNERNHMILARTGSSFRYLPAELRAFSADLDSNGRWVQVPDYGYVWTPAVINYANWSPYRTGRWIWRGGDYVWVAHEPWGWAPYHYGRWAFVASFGWCWVPPAAGDAYWSPGYVGWVRTPEYVSWVPLAPREIYYGRGYYGSQSVNITNVNITQVNVTNVYKNVFISNGVTVVSRNSFNTASPTVVNVNKNIIQQKIFVKNNISVGAPEIKPTRASYFVSARPIPASKLPPQSVRNIRMGELKQSRPIIREPDKSVLQHGGKSQKLQVTTVARPRTPGSEKPMLQNIKPALKGGPGVQGTPPQKIERQLVQPMERAKPVVPGGATPKSVRPPAQPKENSQFAAPGTPGQHSVRPQTQPTERAKPVVPGGATPKSVRPPAKPGENRQFAAPGTPGQHSVRPQTQSVERGQPGVPVKVVPKSAKPKVLPVKKGEPGTSNGPGPRVEKKPGEPVEGVRQ